MDVNLKQIADDVGLGISFALRGLLSAWSDAQVGRIQRKRIWLIAAISLATCSLVAVAVPAVLVVNAALWLVNWIGID